MIFKLIDIKSCSAAKNPKTCIFVSSCPPSLIAHNIFSKEGPFRGQKQERPPWKLLSKILSLESV